MHLTKTQKMQLLQKYGGCCAYCGIELGTRWQKDHVQPMVRTQRYVKNDAGVTQRDDRGQPIIETHITHPERDTLENLSPACIKCNNDKSSMTVERWRELIPHRIHTLNNDAKYASYQKAKRFGLVVECDIKIVFWFEKYEAFRALLVFIGHFTHDTP